MAVTSYGQRTELGEDAPPDGHRPTASEVVQAMGHSGACCHRLANTAGISARPNQQSMLQALNPSFSSGAHDWSHRVIRLPRPSHHQTCDLDALYRCCVHCVRDALVAC